MKNLCVNIYSYETRKDIVYTQKPLGKFALFPIGGCNKTADNGKV